MFNLKLALVSALVMLILEYTVLIRVYKRSPRLEKISLFAAPMMIIIAQYIAHILQTNTNLFAKDRIDNVALFIAFSLLEIPLSLIGYKIEPDATLLERVVVASAFGVASTTIASSITGIQ